MIPVEKIDPLADKQIENLGSKSEKTDLLLEYVAMMTDVELPEEEGDADGE